MEMKILKELEDSFDMIFMDYANVVDSLKALKVQLDELIKKERAKAATVEELFAKIRTTPKYKDVYLITPDASDAHETSVDGTHPSSYGYALWAKSIETPVIEILSKYGIK